MARDGCGSYGFLAHLAGQIALDFEEVLVRCAVVMHPQADVADLGVQTLVELQDHRGAHDHRKTSQLE